MDEKELSQNCEQLMAKMYDEISAVEFLKGLSIGCIFGVIFMLLVVFLLPKKCFAQDFTASYYSEKSCKIEGTWKKYGGLTASGERFNENAMTAAMWNVKFGTKVKVTNLANGKSVVVRINDRGPAKRLVKQGRVIDLSKGSFSRIANLKQGVIKVKVEVIK